MNLTEFIKYLFNGWSYGFIIYLHAYSDRMIVRKTYKKYLKLTIINLAVGIFFEILGLFSKTNYEILFFSGLPLIYLFYYTILSRIYKKKYGINLYVTSRYNDVGDPILADVYYPEDRKITQSDKNFTALLLLLTVSTILILTFKVYLN